MNHVLQLYDMRISTDKMIATEMEERHYRLQIVR